MPLATPAVPGGGGGGPGPICLPGGGGGGGTGGAGGRSPGTGGACGRLPGTGGAGGLGAMAPKPARRRLSLNIARDGFQGVSGLFGFVCTPTLTFKLNVPHTSHD